MEAVTSKPACAKCGADIREGTAFCYACGAAVDEKREAEPTGDLEKTPQPEPNGSESTIETPAEDKLSKAREERRKSRVSQRKPVEYTWEPVDNTRWTVLAALVITGIVAVIVAAMAYWK
jgi:hypothetical protein